MPPKANPAVEASTAVVPAATPQGPGESPDAFDVETFRHGLKPFKRVLLAGLLAAEKDLRDAKLLAEEWEKKLTDYAKSERS